MAPLPDNSTARYFLDYSAFSHQHTLSIRTNGEITPAGISTRLGIFLTAMAGLIYTVSIVGLRYQEAGSDVSLPVTWGGAAAYGAAGGAEYNTALYWGFVGRAASGRRVRVRLFNAAQLQNGNNYRATTTEVPAIATAIAALTGDPGAFLSIDSGAPTWKPYANMGTDAYWRNEIR